MANVLIVDDAKIMRLNLKIILEKLGHQVISEAQNGFEAIDKYKVTKPDFVTMDVTMPSINGINDGIDAVGEIIKYDKDAKIIMVTSHGEQDKVIKAIQNGASNYVLKPIKQDKLEEIINKLNL
jgi:two-component system chemotaxis response regulator CheY